MVDQENGVTAGAFEEEKKHSKEFKEKKLLEMN